MNRKLEYQCCELDNWVVFEGKSTEKLFGEYFLEIANKNVKSRWFAHNGSKFDTLFLLRYLVCERNLIPNVIMNGYRILKLVYKNAEVLDSMLFCPTSLKNLVNMFDFGSHVKKGYYPYDFTDLNYKGVIPDKTYFTKNMDEKELKDFEKWYESKKNETYILRNEVKEYCMNDVFILTKSLLKFHDIILQHAKAEVLFDHEIMTISSLALNVFNRFFPLPNLLGVEPVLGYNGFSKLKNQSKVAIEWLNEINEEIGGGENFRWIYHKFGEKRIENYYIDGYDESTNTIYEFLGCFFHGCSTCYNLRDYNKKCEKTFGKLNMETSSRLTYLRNRCEKIVTMKGCEYLKLEKERGFKKDYEKTPLKIRDLLYGGRTSPAILYKDCYAGGRIHYVDFVSLYPSIQYFNEFPVGDPTVDVVEERNREFLEKEMEKDKCDRRCGFIKCKIIPPSLYFPVLPVKINKLCFPLCFECARLKENEYLCDHSTEKKLLYGTWCLHEIYEALSSGYEKK